MRVVILCMVLCLCAIVVARQTAGQKPITAHITSLNDKDAKRKAMTHPAFDNAGTKDGVEVWRIENFDPVPVPQKDQGKFYKGDSYIVLKTTKNNRNELSWDIHYWLGSQTSQDEAGAAAILTVGLDDKFGGKPVQHREVQGHESAQFLSYFQPAIRYVDGGHASGFSHVTTNAGAEKRFFQIKGKRNVRVRQVEPLISSMNKGDCFILDLNQDIFVYVGEKAKNVEKLKAISVANQIRDQDHNGRGRVDIVDQYSSEADVQRFFTALGSGSRDLVPEESAGKDDVAFERTEDQTWSLYEISDKSGSLKVTPLPKPFKQEQLNPQECYILDTVTGSIYVWVGKQATDKEKTEAMSKAEKFLKEKNYPSWVHVARVPQGTEPAVFKQYFFTWRDAGMSHSRIVRSLQMLSESDNDLFGIDDEMSIDLAKKMVKSGSARSFMPDEGKGQLTVYRMQNTEPIKIFDSSSPGLEAGRLFRGMLQGDCYIVWYSSTRNGIPGSIMYVWKGSDAKQTEKHAASHMEPEILVGRDPGPYMTIEMSQGAETKHFLKIFGGRLVTLLGGNGREMPNKDGFRMFRIFGTEAGVDMRAEQVQATLYSLSSDDAFLVQTPNKNYLWLGKESSPAEKEDAANFVEKILGENTEYVVVEESHEPKDFWAYFDELAEKALTTKQPKWRNALHRVGQFARLFEVITSSANEVSFEKLNDFKQEDLEEDDVYLLDTGDEIYVWVGKETSLQMKKATTQIVANYQARYKNDINQRTVFTIKQGLEPASFTRWFNDWDPDMWLKQRSYEDRKAEILKQNELLS